MKNRNLLNSVERYYASFGDGVLRAFFIKRRLYYMIEVCGLEGPQPSLRRTSKALEPHYEAV